MCLNFDLTPQACQSPMGLHRHVSLRWDMSVSDGSPISDEASQFPVKHVRVFD